MDNNNSLSWDMPDIPHKYENLITDGKTVILVRHFFSHTGDIKEIYDSYIDEKVAEINN